MIRGDRNVHTQGSVASLVRKEGDPVLKVVCDPVELGEPTPWIETLKQVCRRHRNPSAAGLAAPQIGITKRAIVINAFNNPKMQPFPRVLINPVIVERSTERTVAVEMCLSYPGKSKRIIRHKRITVDFADEGRRLHRREFTDFEARVIQHEIDHLDGICRVGDDSPSVSSAIGGGR